MSHQINHRLFDAIFAEAELRQGLEAFGLECDFSWDHYDNSLELKDLTPNFRLSHDALVYIKGCGFSICFCNHTDKWETHYNFRTGTMWRVSYPYTRNDGNPSLLTEGEAVAFDAN